MAQYKAKRDIEKSGNIPAFEAGQVVNVNEIPRGYLGHFELIDPRAELAKKAEAEAAETGDGKESVTNPSLDELKAEADALGITYAWNTGAAKLATLIKEKKDAA